MEESSTRPPTRDGRDPSSRLDPETTTVHETMERISGAAAVFRRFGIDTCCGGELPLATAAERHDVELDQLLGDLDATAATAGEDG